MKKQLAFSFLLILIIFSACNPKPSVKDSSDNVVKKPVDLVYPLLDTENSRWFFFSSACRPFGMVNLSPDTQIGGAWGSGYRYKTDTIKGFSHVHAWQLSGLSLMPVMPESASNIYADFYSKFSHQTEKVSPGYQYVDLDRYNLEVEITSTKRVGFHRYKYNDAGTRALLVNLNTILGPCHNVDGVLNRKDKHTVTGELTNTPTRRRPKATKLYFQIAANCEIHNIEKDPKTGNYLLFFDPKVDQVLLKVGISYTSVKNAEKNMLTELSHWDFDKVVNESRDEWDSYLSRIEIEGGTPVQQRRFYTDLWHALQGRRIISDVNGSYPDYTGKEFRIGQIPLAENGKPLFNHYNSDAFWGAQWTLNTLWGLAYPEIYKEFVQSLMLYYQDGGMVPRGPSGGNYTYVMTGATSTPFIVSAIQKGIIQENIPEIYEALKKNHMAGGIMSKAGYEHDTQLGGGLDYYIKNGYVPYPIPEGKFGYHQDGASLTMEYAYQDWTLAQLAKKLNHQDDYNYFMERSLNFANVYDSESTWIRPKDAAGNWLSDFDPYNYENGFNESNGAQSTWFVPHNLRHLAELMGGKEQAIKKLNQQFKDAEYLGFTSGKAHDREQHPEYRRVPINYGNQPSIQTAFVFHQLDRADLTHFWSRQVVDKAFSGLSPSSGYNGDEDQGLMGSLAVLLKVGLFQMNGGTDKDAEYQIGSPVFDRVSIHLNKDFYKGKQFVIETINNSPENVYIDKMTLNNQDIDKHTLLHKHIVNGGELKLYMSQDQMK